MTTVTTTRFGDTRTWPVRVWEKDGKRIAYIGGKKQGNLEYDLVAQKYRPCYKEVADTSIREQIENQVKGM